MVMSAGKMGRFLAQGAGAFAALACLSLACTGCGSDVGVAGVGSIDTGSSGSDIVLADATGEDAIGGDTIGGDVWAYDIPNPWDTGPIGCTSDANCPSSPCSKGVCDLSSHTCVGYTAPDYSPCPSGAGLCGGDGYCMKGQCVSKMGIVCDDGNPCTSDTCDPATGGCAFTPIPGCGGGCKGDFMCDDNNPCTSDLCSPETGTCMHASIPNCGGCQGDFQCNDNNPCTSDFCAPDAGMCIHNLIPGCGTSGCINDQQCDDYNICSVDKCLPSPGGNGMCSHYADPSIGTMCCDPNSQMMACNDGNGCTSDYCGMNYQCVYQPIPGCGQTGCKSDAECNDGIKCSIDQCQMDAAGQGKCTHYGDLSQKGFCCDPYMNSITCYDGNSCTYDSCGMDYQCSYPIIPGCGTPGCKSSLDCNDGNACTQDMCFGGQCSYAGLACASPDPCTAAACDPKSGQCIYTQIPGCGGSGCKADFQCDDGNFCTIDACSVSSSGAGKCIHKVDPTQVGYCCDPSSSSIPPCNDGDACTQDICAPDYTCQFMPLPGCVNKCKADSECTGGDVCTIAKCDLASGVCLYGSIPNCCNPAWCEDGNPCTKDGCDPFGGCMWTPIPGCIKPCDPAMCNDYNPCTQDMCDPSGNCQNIPTPNCTAQFCKSDPECQDNDPCTQDMCDYSTYTCQHYQVPGCGTMLCKTNAECNDFDACTGDLCINNMCAHKAVTCDDGNPCTADQCLAMTGGCSNAPIPGCSASPCKSDAMCDDKNPCTIDSCVTGFCNHMYVPGCFPPP